eukprot:2080257-Lingulodinium_polyedra.AAC.1
MHRVDSHPTASNPYISCCRYPTCLSERCQSRRHRASDARRVPEGVLPRAMQRRIMLPSAPQGPAPC